MSEDNIHVVAVQVILQELGTLQPDPRQASHICDDVKALLESAEMLGLTTKQAADARRALMDRSKT